MIETPEKLAAYVNNQDKDFSFEPPVMFNLHSAKPQPENPFVKITNLPFTLDPTTHMFLDSHS